MQIVCRILNTFANADLGFEVFFFLRAVESVNLERASNSILAIERERDRFIIPLFYLSVWHRRTIRYIRLSSYHFSEIYFCYFLRQTRFL
jgi:hypothetical protein